MITLVVGLPGSGKTRLVAPMREAGALVLDDFGVESKSSELPRRLDRDLVIVDVNFCEPRVLQFAKWNLAERYGVIPEVVYFENDAEACRANVARRADGRDVEKTIKRFENTYSPPSDAIPVWRG